MLELGIKHSFEIVSELWSAIINVNLNSTFETLIVNNRKNLENLIKERKPIYGVSTGFGQLANQWISHDNLEMLQVNLIRSHAAGVGDKIPKMITRNAMILLANSLAKGYSGIRLETLKLLIKFINNDIIPVSYSIGSLGASGDLAPLAHVALALIGEGKVFYCGNERDTKDVLTEKNIKPIKLEAKEGLALINGTHFVTSFAIHIIKSMKMAILNSLIAGSLSLEAIRGTNVPFDERIAFLRKHPGHLKVSSLMNKILAGSKILESHKDANLDLKVQDPYSFRCIPQVVGAAIDALTYLQNTLIIEVNSVTDNPLIFTDDEIILSGGNFHAEPIGLPLETVKLAAIELANISERRINKLVHPSTKELPPFLASNPGVESGFMIVHYSAAALVNKLRSLAYPAMVDNIPVSGDQEDHVSMAMTTANTVHQVLNLTNNVLAIEILTATRGMNLQTRKQSSLVLEDILCYINENIEIGKNDNYVRPLMVGIFKLIDEGKIVDILIEHKVIDELLQF